MTPVAVVTGASAGIGAALALVFASHGHRVVLVARRADRLQALAETIVTAGGLPPLIVPMDLAQPDVAARLQEALAREGVEPAFLVNNAGFGLIGRAAALDRAGQLAMIDLNMRALTDLSLAFTDSLGRHRGGLLNVASVAGFMPGPGAAVYYASKAYVLSLTEALHRELTPRGIRVTALCPGPVATEFQARAGVSGQAPPWLFAVSAERVAAEGYAGLMQGRRVVTPGAANRMLPLLARVLPRKTLLKTVEARQMGRVNRRATR